MVSRLHLIFGVFVFVVFLATGRLMRADFPDKEIIAPEFRMLMRSRHIYILLSALPHVFLGLYLQLSPTPWRKALQAGGSVLLTLGSALLVGAFFFETYSAKRFSEISRLGLYAALGGTILHFGGAWAKKSSRKTPVTGGENE